MPNRDISGKRLLCALDHLGAADGDLARAIRLVGAPPPRRRPPGFGSLLWIIVGQQLSTASAAAIWQRLGDTVGEPARHRRILGQIDPDRSRDGRRVERAAGRHGRVRPAFGHVRDRCRRAGRLRLGRVVVVASTATAAGGEQQPDGQHDCARAAPCCPHGATQPPGPARGIR